MQLILCVERSDGANICVLEFEFLCVFVSFCELRFVRTKKVEKCQGPNRCMYCWLVLASGLCQHRR